MIPPIVLYTNSEYNDVCKVFFGEIKKFLPNQKIYIISDKDHSLVSENTFIKYNNNDSYVDRLLSTIPQINEDVILFLHEDMILYDYPQDDKIQKYASYVRDGIVDSIKLIYVKGNDLEFEIDKTLISNEYSKFSVQPTLISPKNFVSLLESISFKNIWDFERAVPNNRRDYMVKIGREVKRGIYHYDSIVFPYIATAINKGKWNMSEYSKELDKIFYEYGIVPFERGIV
jgi:hypothetical protein